MEGPALFAAPVTAAAQTPATGLAEVTLALLVIVALIAGLAWLGKRVRGFGVGVESRIQLLSDRAVGPKERLVLVRVGETDILVGVAAGAVHTLHVFPPGANTEAPPADPVSVPRLPDFKQMLMRSLGK